MFQRLLQLNSPPLNIELVEPASFFSLSDPARLRVSCALQQLTAQGHRIWLDDIDEASGRAFLSCRMPLSGIKIDKIAFWRLRATPALANLVTLCSKIAENVLIEGIETETDRKFALQAGALRSGILLAILEMAGGLNGHRQEGSYANDSTPLPASSDRK